jgi:nitrate reductase beta subunit
VVVVVICAYIRVSVPGFICLINVTKLENYDFVKRSHNPKQHHFLELALGKILEQEYIQATLRSLEYIMYSRFHCAFQIHNKYLTFSVAMVWLRLAWHFEPYL